MCEFAAGFQEFCAKHVKRINLFEGGGQGEWGGREKDDERDGKEQSYPLVSVNKRLSGLVDREKRYR